MKVGLAQIAPVLLKRDKTQSKMLHYCERAKNEGCDLIVFSEALLPGYPFWIEHTEGAKFNSSTQKEFFKMYWEAAIDVEAGDLKSFQQFAKEHALAMYLGIIEKTLERGNSLYCSLVFIDATGTIQSVHRKLRPTYEERLFWSPGDGHGLKVHTMHEFRLGGLNCWENWMPMARMALYGLGENVHVSVWPGNVRNTEPMIRFIAQEGRSYSIAVGGIMRSEDIPEDFPHRDLMLKAGSMANGGSCVAGPNGEWVLPPRSNEENLYCVTLNHGAILRERHNFDPSGHYARPDVLQLTINTDRQRPVE